MIAVRKIKKINDKEHPDKEFVTATNWKFDCWYKDLDHHIRERYLKMRTPADLVYNELPILEIEILSDGNSAYVLDRDMLPQKLYCRNVYKKELFRRMSDDFDIKIIEL